MVGQTSGELVVRKRKCLKIIVQPKKLQDEESAKMEVDKNGCTDAGEDGTPQADHRTTETVVLDDAML